MLRWIQSHPKALWILSVTELCERFAFWGVGNLLVLFLLEYYHFSPEKSTLIYGVFTGAAAFLPLFGGWIADKTNYQTPILAGALCNVVGCLCLASGASSLLFVSLILIACGYGIFTPSILTVLGHLYKDTPKLRESGFSIYYASINIGVFLALASLGILAKYASWQVAFFTAGMVQLLGIIPFYFYIKHHQDVIRSLQGEQAKIHKNPQPLTHREKGRLLVIFVFCLASILFWTAYNQGFSSMEIFVHSFMNQKIGSLEVPEGIFLSSESFFLILLAPLLATLYGYLQKRGNDPSPARKTAYSLFAIAACFAVMVFATRHIPPHATSGNITSLYLIGAYFLMALGEMLLAPIGLSMVSRLAPKQYTASLIGAWYVCVGLAFFCGGLLASWMEKISSLSHFFSLFVVLALIPGIVLFFAARRLTALSE